MSTIVQNSESLNIGSVEFVSPDEIKVALDIETPDSVALNAGCPRPFPRVNSYVLIHSEDGYTVGQVEWLTIERSSYPKRKGLRDFGLVDLPFPLRKMSLNPIGTLRCECSIDNDVFIFRRGVESFPSVGDRVLLPTQKQLRAIVESGENRRVKIGTSPLAGNADVRIDPDKLFGRHLAVLGNTGSGKSCSVAGLIQWSMDAVLKINSTKKLNARFIILDPNGEYGKAFSKEPYNVKVFQVDPSENANQLQAPLWMWNSSEWAVITQASSKVQTPFIKRGLRAMRNEQFDVSSDRNIEVKRFLGNILQSVKVSKNNGEPYKQFPHNRNFIERLVVWERSLTTYSEYLPELLAPIVSLIKRSIDNHKEVKQNGFVDYSVYNVEEVDELIHQISSSHQNLGGTEQELLPRHEDVPHKFTSDVFISYLESMAQEVGNDNYTEYYLARIRSLLADMRLKSVICTDSDITLQAWLENYIGTSESSVSVLDLSLVPLDVVHLVTAVISRLIFEALQRYRKHHRGNKILPTGLVMEEAHTFVKRYKDDTENQSAAAICCKVFERIAREGRKFGLGLVLSSQRPSELSPSVLSQCNTFLLHRISNDKDQDIVHRLVPDNLRGLLRDLPILPSQHAILLGWASELPVLVRMNDLPENHRPQSDDPDFWDVWTGNEEREVNWKKIADDWQGNEESVDKQAEPACQVDDEDVPF